MHDPLQDAFAQHYQGRHDPVDALWWVTRPGEKGPSGAPPVQQLFLQVADELEQTRSPEAAAALREALADLLHVDRQQALNALRRAEEDLRDRTSNPCSE